MITAGERVDVVREYEKLYTVSDGHIGRRGARNRSDSGSVQSGDGCYRVPDRGV